MRQSHVQPVAPYPLFVLDHVEAGSCWQDEDALDHLCKLRDIAEADGQFAEATRHQAAVEARLREVTGKGRYVRFDPTAPGHVVEPSRRFVQPDPTSGR